MKTDPKYDINYNTNIRIITELARRIAKMPFVGTPPPSSPAPEVDPPYKAYDGIPFSVAMAQDRYRGTTVFPVLTIRGSPAGYTMGVCLAMSKTHADRIAQALELLDEHEAEAEHIREYER